MTNTMPINGSYIKIGWTRGAVGSAAMVLVLLVCGIAAIPAADELPAISVINPVPVIEISELPHFDVMGKIDEIHADYMIVQDTLIRNDDEFSPEYIRESDRSRLTRSSFKEGDFVGVQQSGIGTLESLWKFAKPLD